MQQKEFNPQSLEKYKGKTAREWRNWIDSAETAFQLAPNYFKTDRIRILWAVSSLEGTPRDAWTSKKEKLDLENYTWDEFKEFFHDLVDDPINRNLVASLAYEKAEMRPNQTAMQFHTYLESIENRFATPFSEERLRDGYYAKLTAQLRMMIANYSAIPKTRLEMVSLATRMEINLRDAEKESKNSKRKREEQQKDSKDQPDQPELKRNRYGRKGNRPQNNGKNGEDGANKDSTQNRPSARKPKCIGCGKPVWTSDCKDPACKQKRKEWWEKHGKEKAAKASEN
jgi:hypothetical protein